MENLEKRVQKLEKKYNTLKYSVLMLVGLFAYAGFSGMISIDRPATAQEAEIDDANLPTPKEAGIPTVVEAQVFILKDSGGTIRGVWTADEESTSFAMMHKGRFPIAAMSVDSKNASLALTDVYKGKISLNLNNSIRSIAVADDTGRNNIYMGLSGAGEASLDLVSSGNTSLVLDGATSSIDMTGDNTVLAMTETVGSTLALKAQPSASNLTFLDHQGTTTFDVSTIDGKTQIKMKSPATKDEKTIVTTPEELLALSSALTRPSVSSTEETVIEEGATTQTGPVDMRSYSPYSTTTSAPTAAAPVAVSTSQPASSAATRNPTSNTASSSASSAPTPPTPSASASASATSGNTPTFFSSDYANDPVYSNEKR